ncbi:hypothetical protein BGZ49_002370 [Haplosporangium sp. Z 27]|nr:hypothetical protein BGZ49_002370 [Haplosporangium sp. Z 27]
MVDHPDHSPQSYSGSQRQQHHHHHSQSSQHRSQHSQHHQSHYPPSSSQSHRIHQHYNQDIQGPLSASVIEGHRAFPSFHGGFHNRSQQQTPASTSYPNLSVADILERYQDSNKEFLVSILNAKAKEDERKTEEERYKTEQIRLQSKQLELELALEKRRGSPPAASGRTFTSGASESSNPHYSTTSGSYRSNFSSYQNSTPTSATVAPPPAESSHQSYSRQSQHDHNNLHPTENAESKHGSGRHHPYQDQSQPSPQGRPPSLKINTAIRQSYPKQQHPLSSQRVPVSPQHGSSSSMQSLPQQGPNSSKATNRHYSFPAISNSAHSSPVANIDYQSHIPPPLTPKEEHVSPTSALSPAPGQNLKRKSVHHDAVMDAVRAKVLRNAGQSQQREREQHIHKKTSLDAVNRRKPLHQSLNGSPEKSKKAAESNGNGSSSSATMAGPKSRHGYGATSPSKQSYSEGGSRTAERNSASPTSPFSPVSATAGSGHSRSCSPPPTSTVVSVSTAGGDAPPSSRSPRKESQNGYSKVSSSIREEPRSESMSSAEDEKAAATSRYEMDRSRAERSSEIGVLAV